MFLSLTFPLLLNWPLSSRLGGLRSQNTLSEILIRWLNMLFFFSVYNDSNSFSSISMVCGNMDISGTY